MKFAMSSESEQFLKLVIKVISKQASQEEQSELKRLMITKPALRDEFSRLESDFRLVEGSAFAELYLRVLFKTASAKEVATLRSLKKSNPTRWHEFLTFASVLQVLGEGTQVPERREDVPELMPEDVRKRLVSGMKQKQKEMKAGKKHSSPGTRRP